MRQMIIRQLLAFTAIVGAHLTGQPFLVYIILILWNIALESTCLKLEEYCNLLWKCNDHTHEQLEEVFKILQEMNTRQNELTKELIRLRQGEKK